MPTAPTHAVVALALGAGFRRDAASPTLLGLGALYSMLPDLDVIGLRIGIAYGDPLGHRGLTHSLSFAVGLALATVAFGLRQGIGGVSALRAWVYLTLATASHGVLDAFTDGGLGIAFFAPFLPTRYFFPWRPIAVAPIGLVGLVRPTILPVLASELLWVWLPAGLLAGVLLLLRHMQMARPRTTGIF